MVIRKIIPAFLLLFILIGNAAISQTKYSLTVKEAVDLAYKNVLELKNAQVDYKIQEALNKETVGMALPQITGNVGANYYLKLPQILFPNAAEKGIYDVLIRENLVSSTTKVPDPTIVALSFQQPWNLQAGVTLTQLLFQPDVFVGLQARQAAMDYSSAVVEQTKEKIKDSAYKRYYAILIAEKQNHFLQESIKRLEKLYHDDSIMYVNGFAEKLDLDRVQVQLNNLNTTQSVLNNSIKLAYAGLKFSLGLKQTDTVELKEKLTPELLKENILDTGFAYDQRAEMKTLDAAKKLGELDIKRFQLGYLPTVALQGNYTVNGQGQQFFTSKSTSWFRSSFVGVNVSVPLFDGFQRKYKTDQAKYRLEKLENNIELVKQGIDLEQLATFESLKNALLNLDSQERNVDLAERVYNITKKKFEQGLGSSFEVLQSDADFQQAQSNYFGALYNATVAKISYQYSLGKL